ncbi:MAG: response regulator transcription factor [Anaerolineales bacterium]
MAPGQPTRLAGTAGMLFWQQLIDNLGLTPTRKETFSLDGELVEHVRALAELEQRPADELAADLIISGLAQRDMAQENWRRWHSLSPREQQVGALVCLGYTNRQIAARLVISVETVKSHIRNILYKFNLHSKRELGLLLGDWDFSAWD